MLLDFSDAVSAKNRAAEEFSDRMIAEESFETVTEPVIDAGSDVVADNFQAWVVSLVKKSGGIVQLV